MLFLRDSIRNSRLGVTAAKCITVLTTSVPSELVSSLAEKSGGGGCVQKAYGENFPHQYPKPQTLERAIHEVQIRRDRSPHIAQEAHDTVDLFGDLCLVFRSLVDRIGDQKRVNVVSIHFPAVMTVGRLHHSGSWGRRPTRVSWPFAYPISRRLP